MRTWSFMLSSGYPDSRWLPTFPDSRRPAVRRQDAWRRSRKRPCRRTTDSDASSSHALSGCARSGVWYASQPHLHDGVGDQAAHLEDRGDGFPVQFLDLLEQGDLFVTHVRVLQRDIRRGFRVLDVEGWNAVQLGLRLAKNLPV